MRFTHQSVAHGGLLTKQNPQGPERAKMTMSQHLTILETFEQNVSGNIIGRYDPWGPLSLGHRGTLVGNLVVQHGPKVAIVPAKGPVEDVHTNVGR